MRYETIEQAGARFAERLRSVRDDEYRHVLRFLGDATPVLDVACGTGTLMASNPERFRGIDINPENVDYCRERGLDVVEGTALDLPFPDESFAAVSCSHLLQVFQTQDAVAALREMARVTAPGGRLVITTLNWFPRFFRHPENARAYPPDAIQRLFAKQRGSSSPMFPAMPELRQVGIWFRRPPLVELRSGRYQLNRAFGVLNSLQYRLGLRKWWTYDAYVAAWEKK